MPEHGEGNAPKGIEPKRRSLPTADVSPELAADITRGEAFVKRYATLFNSMAKDNSLSYELGNGFWIDLKAGKVSVDVGFFTWMRERGLDETHALWAICHEQGHFYDLRNEPEEMLKRYEYLERRSAELAPRILEKMREVHGSVPDYLTKPVVFGSGKSRKTPYINAWIYRMLHRHVYNALDDMFVNAEIGQRAATFRPGGEKAEEVTRLYRDFLFPTDPRNPGTPPRELEAADFVGSDPAQAMPMSYQLCDALLRRRMVPNQAVLVSDEVRAAHGAFADETARQLGITFEKSVHTLTSSANPEAKSVKWRTERIRRLVEPVWLQLLLKDLETMPLPPPPQENDGKGGGKEGQGEEGEPEDDKDKGKPQKGEGKGEGEPEPHDPWDSQEDHPEPIDLDVIRDFIKQKKEMEREKRTEERRETKVKQMSAQDRVNAAQAERDEKICKKHDVDPALAELYRDLERDMKPYERELGEVFEELMRSIEERMRKFWVRGFRSGRFNVNHFITKYGVDLVNEDVPFMPFEALDAHDRREFESRLSLKPDTLRIRLLFDGSGSMTEDRLLALKRLYVLLHGAIRSFEATVNLKFRLQNSIVTDVEVTRFGTASDCETILDFTNGKLPPDKEMAARFRALGGITGTSPGTCDAAAYWKIAQGMSAEEKQRLMDGKVKEILFEVTDGAQNESTKTGAPLLVDVPHRQSVDYMGKQVSVSWAAMQDTANARKVVEDLGVIVRGIQVGANDTLSDEEKAQFDMLWTEGKGARVAEPAAIAPAVARMLADEIRKIQMQIAYQGVDVDDEDEE